MNTFQAHSATSKAGKGRKWLDPAHTLLQHHLTVGTPCPRPGQLSCCSWHRVLPWHLLGTTRAPEHPSCPPDLLEQQAETQQGLRLNTSLWKALRMEHCRWKEMFYQEQSSPQATGQPQLAPLTRPRWQNTQLKGGKSIKDPVLCLNLNTQRRHKVSF